MSRIGKKPIEIPKGVSVDINGNIVTVKGPKGTLTKELHKDMIIKIEEGTTMLVKAFRRKNAQISPRIDKEPGINNMVEGVTNGFEKALEINGVGYRHRNRVKKLVLTLDIPIRLKWKSRKVLLLKFPPPTRYCKGCDKQAVGEFAAKIRAKRKPEVYKGKGIKYENEVIRRKEGKAGAKAVRVVSICRRELRRNDKKPSKNEIRRRKHVRVRKKIKGTPERPRLNVFRSLKNIYAQVIDDTTGNTLVSASTLDEAVKGQVCVTAAIRKLQGKSASYSQKALEKGIKKVVFDRGGYILSRQSSKNLPKVQEKPDWSFSAAKVTME
jgi:large subunit ribosomal protein L6